jgi:hypothetical protein
MIHLSISSTIQGKSTSNNCGKKMKYPEKKIYFIYGNEENRLNECRLELVDHFLSKEEREQNYVEFSPTPSRKKQSLSQIMPDLLGELGTVSFFPDSRRVVVVYNIEDLYMKKEESQAKAAQEAYFIKYLEDQLLESNNILILVNVEDYEQNLRVNEKSNLSKALKKLGHVETFTDRPLKWNLEDAIRERDLLKSLEIIHAWMTKNEESAKRSIFSSLLKQIVLMLQAKVISKRVNVYQEDPSQTLFPKDLKYNLSHEKDFIRRRIEKGQKLYTVTELTEALQKLLKINIILYPQTTDLYVPDFQLVIEHFFVDFMKRRKRI